jgi:hypothetical protein
MARSPSPRAGGSVDQPKLTFDDWQRSRGLTKTAVQRRPGRGDETLKGAITVFRGGQLIAGFKQFQAENDRSSGTTPAGTPVENQRHREVI